MTEDHDDFAPGTRAYYRSPGGTWSPVRVVCAVEPDMYVVEFAVGSAKLTDAHRLSPIEE